MRIIIIGAGWFGNYLAYKLKKFYNVTVLEENNRIMMNAATKNQNRLHLGFHYGRSDETIIQSKIGFTKFKNEFPFLTEKIKDNIYAVANDSMISYKNYMEMMDKHGLTYDILDEKEQKKFQLKNIDLAIRVDEEFILAKSAQKFFSLENKDVILYNQKVKNVFQDKNRLSTEDNNIYEYDVLINTTYSDTNKLYKIENQKPLKYEYCVLPLYRSKKIDSSKFALTIMDGPFCSLYPYKKHFFTLSSVPLTPLGVYKEDIDGKIEQELWKDLRSDYFKYKKYQDMESQLYHYISPDYVDIKYFNEFFVRKVKYLYDECDRRDTSVLFNHNIITIYPGKIDSIMDTFEEVGCYLKGLQK